MVKILNDGEQLDVAVCDFSKAFHKVNHHKLHLKVKHYVVSGKLLNSLKDYLHRITQL